MTTIFIEEIREGNRKLLTWSIAVFNVFCLSWSVLDQHLAPEHWRFFLTLRIALVVITSVIVLAVHHPALRRRTLEAWWLCAVAYGVLMAPTIPLAGEGLNAHVMGYVLIILTIGFLPVWSAAWVGSALGVIMTGVAASHFLWSAKTISLNVASEWTVLLSAAGVSIVSAAFKYSLLRREHASRTALVQMNYTDPLTKLKNRRFFDSEIEREFARSQRFAHPLSCLMIDIDHFKSINDTYGHAGGDDVLRWIGERIAATTRSVDTAARLGGEEFVILMPETAGRTALAVAERLVADIADASEASECPRRITISIGVASTECPEVSDPLSLLDRADRMLYRAKGEGRNRAILAIDAFDALQAA